MARFIQRIINHRFILILCLLFCSAYFLFFANRALLEVTIKVEQTTFFKIYWAKSGQSYSEQRSVRVRVRPDREQYQLFITDLSNVERLRIDPHKYAGPVTINAMTIRQRGFKPLHFNTPEDFKRLIPLNHIVEAKNTPQGFYIMSGGNDPFFEFSPHLEKTKFGWAAESLRFLAISILVCLLWYCLQKGQPDLRYIPLLLAMVLLLVMVMSSVSTFNVHPDEFVHYHAAAYYKSHWLPPDVEDPSIRHTYSIYGVSRLNSHEIAYLFIGKFNALLSPLQVPDFQSCRLFNVMLLALILICTIHSVTARMLVVPFLLSPQIWYIFSYCNSDGFALFIAFLLAWQLVSKRGILKRALFNNNGKKLFLLTGSGLLFGLLFFLKKNYAPYIVFLLLVILYQWWPNRHRVKLQTISFRLVVILTIGLAFFGTRKVVDIAVNGFDRSQKISQLREELAGEMFKPSTPPHKQHSHLHRKAKGDSLMKVITVHRWFEKSFRSAFGVYGYFTVSASDTYYDLVRWTGLAFLLFFCASILLRAGPHEKALLALALLLSFMLIGVSLYHSWTKDFQTQGRYLFPIAPMLGICYVYGRNFVEQRIFQLFVFTMFSMAAYSFIYVALFFIPKAVLP